MTTPPSPAPAPLPPGWIRTLPSSGAGLRAGQVSAWACRFSSFRASCAAGEVLPSCQCTCPFWTASWATSMFHAGDGAAAVAADAAEAGALACVVGAAAGGFLAAEPSPPATVARFNTPWLSRRTCSRGASNATEDRRTTPSRGRTSSRPILSASKASSSWPLRSAALNCDSCSVPVRRRDTGCAAAGTASNATRMSASSVAACRATGSPAGR